MARAAEPRETARVMTLRHTLSLVLTLASPLLSMACAHHPATPTADGEGGGMHHRFDDAEAWAARFEDPARDAWQKPAQVVEALALKPDAKVADIGSATGYFSVRLAKAVPQGKVFGVDVESSMQKYLASRAEKEGLTNLVAVLGGFDDAKLPEAVDAVLIVDTYHHIDARPAYFQKLKASLAPGATVAIIDFTLATTKGPPKEHRLAPEAVTAELAQAGFALKQQHDFLPDQYFLVFTVK